MADSVGYKTLLEERQLSMVKFKLFPQMVCFQEVDEMSNDVKVTDMSMEDEAALIFDPLLNDIFPMFVNMLDIKSFMRLALTSKSMYNRCMDDNRIKLTVHESDVTIFNSENAQVIKLGSYNVSSPHATGYLTALRHLNCSISLKFLAFLYTDADAPSVEETREELEAIGIRKIKTLDIGDGYTDWPALTGLVKDYNVEFLEMNAAVPEAELPCLLELNLFRLSYHEPIDADFLLNVTSPIKRIELFGIPHIPQNLFMQLLWKIQTGTLNILVLNGDAVDMSGYNTLPFEYDGQLPGDRPIVFLKDEYSIKSYFFLHFTGGVTFCYNNGDIMEIFKCYPEDLPPAAKSKQLVFQNLEQKDSWRISCSQDHFLDFFKDRQHVPKKLIGELPTDRPLVFKEGQAFWMLREDEALVLYKWGEGYAHCTTYDLITRWPPDCKHAALERYIFKTMLLNKRMYYFGDVKFKRFHGWISEFEELPYDSCGPLPSERPLIFEKTDIQRGSDEKCEKVERRAILLEDGTVMQCTYDGDVAVERCDPWNLPSVLITSESLREILEDAPLHQKLELRVKLEVFRDSFNASELVPFSYSHPLTTTCPVAFSATYTSSEGDVIERRWIRRQNLVAMCEWERGRVSFCWTKAHAYPPAVTNELVKEYLQGRWRLSSSMLLSEVGIREQFPTVDLFLDLPSLNRCLEGLKILPHNFSGPLPDARPLVFVKNDGDQLRAWSLCEGEEVVYACWREEVNGDRKVSFTANLDGNDVPPVLRTTSYLKTLLEKPFNPNHQRTIKWFGTHKNYTKFFASADLIKLRKYHKGQLRKERPLVFSSSNCRWFLRQGNSVVSCHWKENHAELSLPAEFSDMPPIVRDLCTY